MKFPPLVAFAFSVLLLFTACGEGEPDIALTPAAEQGRDIARANGCSSCHGKNGQGVTAPSWQGLFMERVPLEDGRLIRADEDYLYRAITDPQADIHEGWSIKMPSNELNDDQVASIIAYIKELQ